MEREDFAREELERDAGLREAVERLVLRDVPELFLVLRVEREEELDLVSAPRSLSKSASAALLVFAALRRNAPSAAVTSL
ncbi:MAG TPA: hypothetical protein VL980_01525 [Gemmatimonadaceae bacterium]|nr:hypothetical protein [Gemmatimonadaceae bacterium]